MNKDYRRIEQWNRKQKQISEERNQKKIAAGFVMGKFLTYYSDILNDSNLMIMVRSVGTMSEAVIDFNKYNSKVINAIDKSITELEQEENRWRHMRGQFRSFRLNFSFKGFPFGTSDIAKEAKSKFEAFLLGKELQEAMPINNKNKEKRVKI